MSSSAKSTVTMSTVMRDISDALSLDRNDRKEVILFNKGVAQTHTHTKNKKKKTPFLSSFMSLSRLFQLI